MSSATAQSSLRRHANIKGVIRFSSTQLALAPLDNAARTASHTRTHTLSHSKTHTHTHTHTHANTHTNTHTNTQTHKHNTHTHIRTHTTTTTTNPHTHAHRHTHRRNSTLHITLDKVLLAHCSGLCRVAARSIHGRAAQRAVKGSGVLYARCSVYTVAQHKELLKGGGV
jgi:hypothetical protein